MSYIRIPGPPYILHQQGMQAQRHFPAIDAGRRMFEDSYPVYRPKTSLELYLEKKQKEREENLFRMMTPLTQEELSKALEPVNVKSKRLNDILGIELIDLGLD